MFSAPDTTLTIFSLILFFTISSIPKGVAAQSSMSADPSFSLCMAVIVVFMGLFIASFSIYIRYCSSRPSSAHSGFLSAARANKAAEGLDRWTIESFPTFTYAEVKDHKIISGDLECAVCLTEFEDAELLRLIPKCDHVFHPECIDAWLGSHVTCPVCRAILDMDSGTDETDETETVQVVCENPPVQEPVRHCLDQQNRLPRNESVKSSRCGFRSYSTGHDSGLNVEGVDVNRFYLPIPEEEKKEIMQRAMLNRAKSGTTKEPKTGSGKRIGSSPIFARNRSMKSRDNNCEGSSSKGLRPTFMIPSIKCIDVKPTNVMVDPV